MMTTNLKGESCFSTLGVFEQKGLGPTNGEITSYIKKYWHCIYVNKIVAVRSVFSNIFNQRGSKVFQDEIKKNMQYNLKNLT
jgi:hypothetical protein